MRSAGATYGLENGFLEGALLFPPVRRTASLLEFSLCLSRACLGKMFVFLYKWLNNAVFRRRAISWRAGRRLGSTTSLTARSCPPGATGARSSYVCHLTLGQFFFSCSFFLLFQPTYYRYNTPSACLPAALNACSGHSVLCYGDALRGVRSYSSSAGLGSSHRPVGALVRNSSKNAFSGAISCSKQFDQFTKTRQAREKHRKG
jgi:hypothetical protein